MTIKLSGFGDEISPELEEQLEVLAAEGIHYLELRTVGKKNVLEFTKGDLEAIRERLEQQGFRISAVASPVGKVLITEELGPQLVGLEKAIRVAKEVGTPFVRIFSFFILPGERPEQYRDEVLRRLEAMVALAQDEEVILLHENEKDIYGDTGRRCREILTGIESPNLRAIFDFANFVEIGEKPEEAWELLCPYVAYFHIKDARLGVRNSIVLPGEGDGDIPRVLKKAVQEGFTGFASLEPHLQLSERFSGFSGPEGFRAAAKAFKATLRREGISWE